MPSRDADVLPLTGADCFLRALFNECYGTALAMRRIRRVTPEAKFVLTEDIGKTFSTPLLRQQADHQLTHERLLRLA